MTCESAARRRAGCSGDGDAAGGRRNGGSGGNCHGYGSGSTDDDGQKWRQQWCVVRRRQVAFGFSSILISANGVVPCAADALWRCHLPPEPRHTCPLIRPCE